MGRCFDGQSQEPGDMRPEGFWKSMELGQQNSWNYPGSVSPLDIRNGGADDFSFYFKGTLGQEKPYPELLEIKGSWGLSLTP